MKGGAHLTPFAALSFADSKKDTCLLLGCRREFSTRWMETGKLIILGCETLEHITVAQVL